MSEKFTTPTFLMIEIWKLLLSDTLWCSSCIWSVARQSLCMWRAKIILEIFLQHSFKPCALLWVAFSHSCLQHALVVPFLAGWGSNVFSCGKVCCFSLFQTAWTLQLPFPKWGRNPVANVHKVVCLPPPRQCYFGWDLPDSVPNSQYSARQYQLVKESSPDSCLFVNWGIQFCLSSYTQEDNCHNE